ncbi:MFS transporter [Roseateles sp. DC23W]|uniref:MFS transporter n=1 Tax=Pelomonas dachongensis TaxID=3299029 RepID=A0ABW7EKY1_9BURK
MNTPRPAPAGLSVQQVLLCGALIVTLSMGIRHGFGFWLQPIITERGWTRETFSFAMAVQNLAWGIAGPIAGMAADRFGAWKVLIAGGVCYALGLLAMAVTSHPLTFTLGAGVLIGIAQSGSTYAVIYGVLGRTVSPEKRSWAFGVAAAAGSLGQFVMIPVETWLISHLGWQAALFLLAATALLIAPLALGIRERQAQGAFTGHQSIGQALREAFGYRSFQLLMLGYFVCGFQVVFIGVHLPSYLKDHGLGIEVSTGALMLIGLFNIFGTYAAGLLGQRYPKRYLLSAIYGLRAVAILAFISLPLTPLSVYLFAAVIGFLWLSTVPPTNAVVAQIFGAQHLSMLGGFVFLSHQVGSFLGVWLGGKLYDATGSYDVVWWLAIALGVMAMLANLPVRESAIVRAQPA